MRERMIPKAPGSSAASASQPHGTECVQASLKLVLEPIFEADFHPCFLRVPSVSEGAGRHHRDPPTRHPLL